jgi:hypothetical protein
MDLMWAFGLAVSKDLLSVETLEFGSVVWTAALLVKSKADSKDWQVAQKAAY